MVRIPEVAAFVRQRAAGKCEACRAPAPFTTGSGNPFLEVHHLVLLAHGGPDVVDNTVAICPNCHRELHYGERRDKLRVKVQQRVFRHPP